MTWNDRYARYAPLILVVVTAILFWPSLSYDFINLDDPYLVVNNPDLFRRLTWSTLFAPVAGLYHPLTNFSYWLDVQIHGGKPQGFHATNLILHLLSVVAVYFWSLRLSISKITAFFIAAAFAWHPTHVESVVWISERKDVLSVLFFWLSLYCHLRLLADSGNRWWWLCIGSAALSLAAKPFAVTLPVVFVLIEAFKNQTHFVAVLKKRWSLLSVVSVMALASGLSAYFAQTAIRKMSDPGFLELPYNLILQFLFYLQKTVWPFALQILYLKPDITPNWVTAASVGFLVAVYGYGFIRSAAFRRELTFGLLFFTVTLAPMLKLIPFGDESLVADRYLYVAQTGLLWPIANAAARFSWRIFLPLGFVVLSIWMYGSWLRLADWENSETMWYSLISAQPGSKQGHEYLGRYLLGLEKHEEALVHFRQGQIERPDNLYNQAFSLLRLGRKGPADEKLKLAESMKPNDPQVLNLRGNWHLESGNIQQAEEYFMRSLALPAALLTELIRAEAQTNVGVLKFRMGKLEECLQWQERALISQPGYIYALYNQGLCNWGLKRPTEAEASYKEVLRRQPRFPMAHNGLGVIAFERGDYRLAADHFGAALDIDPTLEVAKTNLGLAIAKMRSSQNETGRPKGDSN